MKTFRSHLSKSMKDQKFRDTFNEEKALLDIAVRIAETRTIRGWSQKELAQKAHVTQQQLSKVENGVNCNIVTFLKICQALDVRVDLEAAKSCPY